jgi:hypothetical protein
MNTKKLNALYSKLEGILGDMVMIHDKAQEAYDRKSEKWKGSEAGELEYTRISELESAISDLENSMSCLDNAKVEDD